MTFYNTARRDHRYIFYQMCLAFYLGKQNMAIIPAKAIIAQILFFNF